MKLLCSIFFFAYYNSSSANASLPLQVKMDTIQPYSIKIVRSNANTSGYEIYSGKKLFIRQLTIPGMPGNKGFEKKSDAEKVAKTGCFESVQRDHATYN